MATLVVAVLAIFALWRIALRLEKSWAARSEDQKAFSKRLEDESEKRVAVYREVQKIADTMTAAVQGVTIATEHRTEMTKNIFDAQAGMATSLGRFTDGLAGLARQNDQQCRDLDQLLARSESCRAAFDEVARRIEEAARRIEEASARRTRG
jgi:hypothetical protein